MRLPHKSPLVLVITCDQRQVDTLGILTCAYVRNSKPRIAIQIVSNTCVYSFVDGCGANGQVIGIGSKGRILR